MGVLVKNPPAPGSGQWRGMITASKVPAILGVSRFKSSFSLWHEMAGLVEPTPMNEGRAAWGHIAEESLAKWWQKQNPGWYLNRPVDGSFEVAYTDETLPFPNIATLDRRASRGAWRHIVECKTAFSFDGWGRVGEANSIPMDYLSQLLFQMGVSGIHRASIVLLGPSMVPEIHPVAWDEEAYLAIVAECEKWHRSILAGDPPPLDSRETTYETLRGLHPDIDRDLVVETDLETATAIVEAERAKKDADRAVVGAKSTAADLMGNARLLLCGGEKIADRRAKSGGRPYVTINRKAAI